MGLAVTVGNPCTGLDAEGEAHYRDEFAWLSAALAAEGVAWSAPDAPPPPDAMRRHEGSFPHSFLHYLRRVYALQSEGRPVTPVSGVDEMHEADALVMDLTSLFGSHLLCHADGDGYYVPADLPGPLLVERPGGGGEMVGSSAGLLAELVEVAPAIGVRLDPGDALGDAEAARLTRTAGDPFEIEQVVWLALHEACRASVATGHAVVFH
jgi:hypothetical protein